MHERETAIGMRVDRFVRERLQPAVHRAAMPLDVAAWEVPDEPVPFADAVRAEYTPFAVGQSWGRPWGTTWFRVAGRVPVEWKTDAAPAELELNLGFHRGLPGFQAEGLVYRADGSVVKALEPFNSHVRLEAAPGEPFEYYIEAASNPDVGSDWSFAPSRMGDKATAGAEQLYALLQADIVLRDVAVWELLEDVRALLGLARELPAERSRRAQIMRALERCVDVIDPHNVSATAAQGRSILAEVLAKPADASAHRLVAVGHAHIDSAWLWPTRETVRKCARTFSNVLDLMDTNPDFVFAASSAQQYAWVKRDYPELFERIRARVREGRFVPVGGMFVESDTNLPGGEALVRQFVFGRRFFEREFGVNSDVVWLPDSFGYSAALPQIAVAAGARYFLTQKLSWNETNTFPHSSFLWEGIDGTRVFTHFPPVDTYSATISAAELAKAERQYADKAGSNISLLPFGHGDGGGGPTREMLAQAARTASLEGSPAVELGSPQSFFEQAEADYARPPVWSGELYLEFHRGTYTSQARTKRGNRRSEQLLREAELWAATAAVRMNAPYPYEQLESIWQTVLLQQFHDILPGSSIAWVHQEAERNYARVETELETLIDTALTAMTDAAGGGHTAVNAAPYPVRGVPAAGSGTPTELQRVHIEDAHGDVVMENDSVRLRIAQTGRIVSHIERDSGRELIAPGEAGNVLQLFRDTPTQWDAWDIDENYQRTVVEADAHSVIVAEGAVRLSYRLGDSEIEQWVRLEDELVVITTHVDWHETQKLLKLGFAFDVHAERAASEIQFGHVHRATHANTSWDSARFETSAHRWVHVGEPGFGVAVANDANYGHDITRGVREGGGTITRVRESLVRAPLFPDPHADQGRHEFRTVVRAGGIPEAIAAGYRTNLPLRPVPGAAIDPLVTVTNPAIVVEAVKLADDRSGDVIVRLYEAYGARASGSLVPGFACDAATRCDVHETPFTSGEGGGDRMRLTLRPFEIVTLRLARR